MTLNELRRHYSHELEAIYSKEESSAIITMLIEHLFGYNRVALVLAPDLCLDESEEKRLEVSVAELMRHKPIQYIIGKTEFCGFEFHVDENVLIPRPETEEMVNMIADGYANGQHHGSYKPHILDIGTGSGCIAISLSRLIEDSIVTAVDISEGALKVAEDNARLNHANVEFIHADILSHPTFNEKYDIIVSNPPYICNREKSTMRNNVLDFEPHTALFVSDDDPLLFYRKIINLAKDIMNHSGTIWFEINETFGDKIKQLCHNYGYTNIKIVKDLMKKDRFVMVSD